MAIIKFNEEFCPKTLKIKKLNANTLIPEYQTKGSSGFDLAAIEDVEIWPDCYKTIKTGIAMNIPQGYEGQVRPRSGLAAKYGLTVNSPGTIDSDYNGEVKVTIVNHSNKIYKIKAQERIAQMVIAPVEQVKIAEVNSLDHTDRGSKGFGSTGEI